MKTILVISDSHGNKEKIKELVNCVKHDYVFFLGDVLKDVLDFNDDNFIKVKGNWDFGGASPQEIVTIENKRFLLTHGHNFGVRFGMGYLINYAIKEHIDVVCYGHTHISDVSNIEGVWFVNPGALSTKKSGENTYAKIILNNDSVDISILKF